MSGGDLHASALLILNIQATVVPLVALLPLASGDASEELLGRAGSSAVTVLVGEVGRYWVMVAVAGTALAVAVLISALLWMRRPTTRGSS